MSDLHPDIKKLQLEKTRLEKSNLTQRLKLEALQYEVFLCIVQNLYTVPVYSLHCIL